MRGTSRTSLADARDRLQPLVARGGSRGLGEELYAVARLLDSSVGLRRALTDPAHGDQQRVDLVTRLLRGQVGEDALDVVSGTVRQRWAEPGDLPDAVEALGTEALLASAQADGQLDQVEDELFRFSRAVAGDRALAQALDDRGAPADSRGALVDRLLAGRTAPVVAAMVRQVVASPRARRTEPALERLVEAAAQRRARLLAVVTAAAPLTTDQQERLAAALGRVYGARVLVEVDVDPEVLGGLRVRVGDEELDGTTASRLAAARRRTIG